VHLSPLGFAACQSKKCTNRARTALLGGALVSSAPTEQEVTPTEQEVTPTEQEVTPTEQELLQQQT